MAHRTRGNLKARGRQLSKLALQQPSSPPRTLPTLLDQQHSASQRPAASGLVLAAAGLPQAAQRPSSSHERALTSGSSTRGQRAAAQPPGPAAAAPAGAPPPLPPPGGCSVPAPGAAPQRSQALLLGALGGVVERHPPPHCRAAGAARQEHAAPCLPLGRPGGAAPAVCRARVLPEGVRLTFSPSCCWVFAWCYFRALPYCRAGLACRGRHSVLAACCSCLSAISQQLLHPPPSTLPCNAAPPPALQLLHRDIRAGHLHAQPAAGLP